MNIKVIHREAGMEDLVATSPPPSPPTTAVTPSFKTRPCLV